jgi:DNA/RNA endonuclease YhcR with UshA esterase domain
MKVNLKRILFIIVCAELMMWYWAQLEVLDPTKRQIVYQNNGNYEIQTPNTQTYQETILKKAS